MSQGDTQQPAPKVSSLQVFPQGILGIRGVSQVPLPFQAGIAKCGTKPQVSGCENSGRRGEKRTGSGKGWQWGRQAWRALPSAGG